MAQDKMTVWQRLGKVFGPNATLDQQSPVFKFDKKELLKTTDKDEFEREKLQSQQSFGSMIKSALGVDPMSQMADGMVKLAKAYDKLASSITKMGTAMNNINDKKLSQMERMSKIKTKTESKGFFGSLGEAAGSGAGAVAGAGMAMVASAGGGGSKKEREKEKEKVGKYGNLNKQNDLIIDLLKELNEKLGPGSSIDTVMQKKMSEKASSSLQ